MIILNLKNRNYITKYCKKEMSAKTQKDNIFNHSSNKSAIDRTLKDEFTANDFNNDENELQKLLLRGFNN